MKEFLEKSLRQQVTIMEDKELYKKFPLVYRGRYDIFKVETNGVVWMAIYPKDNVGLIMLRRDRAKVEKITGLNCAIFLEKNCRGQPWNSGGVLWKQISYYPSEVRRIHP